jgi:hypothetical protein
MTDVVISHRMAHGQARAGCEKVDTGFSLESRSKLLELITFMILD